MYYKHKEQKFKTFYCIYINNTDMIKISRVMTVYTTK